MFKSNKAITMIALIITIIVLLILAGVTINMVLGENGLFNKSKTSVGKYENSSKDEEKIMGNIQNYIDNYFNSKNTREGETELKSAVLEMVYPVGSIYIGTTNVNPATFIGGEWEQYAQGRTLIGEGTNGEYTFTAESTGTTVDATTNPLGEYKHQLSIGEMPSHNHIARLYLDQDGFNQTIPAAIAYYKISSYAMGADWYNETSNKNRWSIGDTSNTGSSQSHNNIQPYIVTYMWKRVR